MNGDKVDTYVRTPLAPTLKPGDVVIWDNLNVRKSRRAAAIAEKSMGSVPAALFARPQSHRYGFLKAQNAPAKEKSQDLRRPMEIHRCRL
jgi:hypothetical protein